ncbi:MAG: hypothetical protein ACPLZY_03760 [Candidatus Norongarragalinales archaeon]
MRARKSVLGLVALGLRESEPKSVPKQEFRWFFGVPSARQTKRGIRWTLRTPKRLQKLGLPSEVEVGVVEGRLNDLRTKGELVSSFLKAVRSADFARAHLLKVLPGSELHRLMRGPLKAEEKPKRLALPLYVKLNGKFADGSGERLEAVDLVKGSRGEYAVFASYRVPVKADHSVKAEETVKAELKRRGFKVLTVKVKSRRKGKSNEEHSEGGLYSEPWDFTVHASKFILARSRDEIVRRMLPYLLRAPPQKRSYLVQIMDETRMALSGILDPHFKRCVQVGFEELKPWLMPRSRCETLEKFMESLLSLFRCFFLEPYNLKRGTFGKCIRWWLYQDALFYLKRLLRAKEVVGESMRFTELLAFSGTA